MMLDPRPTLSGRLKGMPSMTEKKFDPKKLQKLNNPQRLIDIPPDYVWQKLNVHNPEVMVEIGAGTGFFSIAFLQESKTSTLYACDLSDIMIDWMQANVAPKYPHIIPLKAEEHAVPLDDGITDLVFMINVHHELEDPVLTLEEAKRITKPEGKIFIVDWKKEDMPEGPPTEIRYLPERVKQQLLDAGFKHIDIYNDLQKHFLVIGAKDRP
jgi:ubiquinone/menaquinone biosynthesis C-methylase UbiE